MVTRGTFRSLWKAISSLYEDFYQRVSFKVGKGDKVRFWEDRWEGEDTFKRLFPSLFRLSTIEITRGRSHKWDSSFLSEFVGQGDHGIARLTTETRSETTVQ